MTDSDHKRVLGQFVVGSGPQWTFLGSSEAEAMAAVDAARKASGVLTAWSSSCMVRAVEASIVEARLVEANPVAPKKKARQINGVSKALSPEYSAMFGKLASDFIAVDVGLSAYSHASKK